MTFINRCVFAILVPALLGFGLGAWYVSRIEFNGWTLFLGVPVLVSFLAGFCTAFQRAVSITTAYWNGVLSLLCLGGFILARALDFAVLLLIALPLAMLLGTIGAVLGWIIGRACRGRIRAGHSSLVV